MNILAMEDELCHAEEQKDMTELLDGFWEYYNAAKNGDVA
jgi:hypothetical protein